MGIPEKVVDYFARARVSFGFFVVTGAALFLRPFNFHFVIAGLSISLLGLTIRSWAAGTIKKFKELATTGPYAFVRHPLYLGSLLMVGGFVLALSNPASRNMTIMYWALVGVHFFASYAATIFKEDLALREKFSEQWVDYKKNVPALIPVRIPKLNEIFSETFSAKQYLKNKEYRAVAAWMAAAVFLLLLLPGIKGR